MHIKLWFAALWTILRNRSVRRWMIRKLAGKKYNSMLAETEQYSFDVLPSGHYSEDGIETITIIIKRKRSK